jgi:hypothetical protein
MSAENWSWLRLFVIVLLALQAVAVILVWVLNPIGQQSEAQFALLLAADLVAFTMISYAARHGSEGERVNGGLVLVGSGLVMFFMLMVLFVEVI